VKNWIIKMWKRYNRHDRITQGPPRSKADLVGMTTLEKVKWLQSDDVRQVVLDNGLQSVRDWDRLMQRAEEFLNQEDES
jgi:hypothetical protein